MQVSTFSALLIMERRRVGLWSAYYNGGGVPLENFLPLYAMPWVFTYNDYSDTYNDLMQAAVTSAVRAGVKPHCLYYGNLSAPVVKWMEEHGVTMVPHEPLWTEELVKVANAGSREHQKHSHLFTNESSLIGTYQRVDIPLAFELAQYAFVLFTDCDVYFRRPFRLTSFPHPLPPYAAMAIEMEDKFPFNAGVMLMNMQGLRRTYERFLSFILENEYGAMLFPGYGPGDQGAYNQFYASSVQQYKLPEVWNAKPYKPFNPEAYVVHFHGPKPTHYQQWLKTHSCLRVFMGLCELGFQQGLCSYMKEYHFFSDKGPQCH
jgi:hypothetical protein